MSAKGIGTMLVFLGLGSLLLPLAGLQFRIMSIFGENAWIAGIVAIAVGVMMFLGGQK